MSEREARRRSASQRELSIRGVGELTPYLHSGRIVVRSDRPELQRRPEPEYHQNGIGAAGDLTICGQHPLRRPEQVEQASRRRNCAAPDSSATTRQGIKNASSPAGNVGERARRRASQRGFRSGVLASVDPVPPQRPHRRSLRSPERQRRAPNRNITKTESAPPATAPSAASTRCAGPSRSSRHRAAVTAPRRILGHHPPRDKERQLASRKCRRESTT